MSNVARRIYHRMSKLTRPQTVEMLSAYFFISRTSVYNALLDLSELGLVEYLGYGKGWRLIK